MRSSSVCVLVSVVFVVYYTLCHLLRKPRANAQYECCRTDYHVAPEDMLRLGLAVFHPSSLHSKSVPSGSNHKKPITYGPSPRRGRAIVRVPSSHPTFPPIPIHTVNSQCESEAYGPPPVCQFFARRNAAPEPDHDRHASKPRSKRDRVDGI